MAAYATRVGLTLAITAVAGLGDGEDGHAWVAGIADLILEGEQVLWGDDTALCAQVDEGIVVLGAHGAAFEAYIYAGDGRLFGEVFAEGVEEGGDALSSFLDVVYRSLAHAAP